MNQILKESVMKLLRDAISNDIINMDVKENHLNDDTCAQLMF